MAEKGAYWHQGRALVGDDCEPHPLDADGASPIPTGAYRPCVCARKNHGDVAWRCPNEASDLPGQRSCEPCRSGRCPSGRPSASGDYLSDGED